MEINDSLLSASEKIIFSLRGLYSSRGYRPYRMSKFEEYDLYAGNKDFLVSSGVITFTDTDGKLMSLRPDVTLSIIKNSADSPAETQKVFYSENVYRVSKGTGSFGENMQVGVECFGAVGDDEVCEVLTLASESLAALGGNSVLALSDLGVLTELIDGMTLTSDEKKRLWVALGEKNLHEIESICGEGSVLSRLITVSGNASDVLPELEELLAGVDSFTQFARTVKRLGSAGLRIDFSVTDDPNYYNGIVFKGFLQGVPTAVLSGGRYDNLMRRLGRRSSAIGFAVYTDALERVSDEMPSDDGFVNVALPKGRLGEKIYSMFAEAGFECPSILEENRKLIFENPDKKIRYFWVKPSDVAIYVERGAADIGVAGKDILLEYEPDVYELLDLKRGKCRMAVAAPKDFADDTSRTLIVATKFANIAKEYYRSVGRDIDIIHLNGSIEIAPILGLSDVIVDIVETGATLRENDLEVKEEILPISARLVANKSSFKFKSTEIENIARGLAGVVK